METKGRSSRRVGCAKLRGQEIDLVPSQQRRFQLDRSGRLNLSRHISCQHPPSSLLVPPLHPRSCHQPSTWHITPLSSLSVYSLTAPLPLLPPSPTSST